MLNLSPNTGNQKKSTTKAESTALNTKKPGTEIASIASPQKSLTEPLKANEETLFNVLTFKLLLDNSK